MFGWEFPPHNSGGLGTACLGLTRALSQEGFDITFVLPKKVDIPDSGVKMAFANIGTRVRTVDSPLCAYVTSERYLRGKHGGLYGPDLLSEVRRYALLGGALVSEGDFDVIYAHDWLSFGAGLEAKRISGKPLIVHVHATEFDRCGGPSGINDDVYAIEREGMQQADCVIAVSHLTKNIIAERYGIAPEKVVVVHNGIDDVTFPYQGHPTRRFSELKKAGYKIVLFVGRMTLQKGPDYFIRAAKRVLEFEEQALFIMAGSGDMEAQLMRDAASLGVAENVIFAGFLRGEELADAYASADLYVMPSVSEPFGITSLEAIRSGTPVLISKQSGVSEAVKHALKADFWDVDEMADKIISVIGNPVLGKTLSSNAGEEVRRISWDRAAKKLKEIIEALVRWVREGKK